MTTATQSRKAQSNVVVSESHQRVMEQAAEAAQRAQRALIAPTVEEVRRAVEGRLLSQFDKVRTSAEEFGPTGSADIFAIGPVQFTPPALPPSQVIAIGETAYVSTVLFLNPMPIWSGMSPKDMLEGFHVDCTLQYRTGNLSTWTLAEASLQVDSVLHLSPGGGIGGSPFYLDIQPITPTQEGIYELNIAARIVGPGPGSHFAGFATWMLDFDEDFLATVFGLAPAGPGFFNKTPVRYNVYQP
jgi:hypothetical protein